MATIYDIAKAVGVAKSTVANALSGKGTVSEATRQRILQCAQEMGYRPNIVARSLYSHKTFTLALILPTIANPFYPEIAEAVEHIAREHEYQILLCNTHRDFVIGKQQMERMVSRWVDGYIIMGSSMDIADITTYFQRKLPIVLCDWQENESPLDIPQVSVDFYRAGQLAAQHLLDLGHRNVAVIVDEPQQTLRLEGFRSVLHAAGLQFPQEMIQQGQSTIESGIVATQRLLAGPVRPTAIFTTNDWMALGAIEAIITEGLQVPQDISVIGLDDITAAAHLRPPLTTIAIPKLQLAKEATCLLLSQINEEHETATSRLIEPYLVIRKSTTFASN
ncbi:LacI family transcriptional regulator [Reticulibacter mediterranei]|uniref:LacI family transcriptional regulator n=1 Tax=Reticulibacter mediterranei TaxID=2778369 RepID=A0A8J3IVZ7_9CHLR|nr:LacI family DNA-binding transcriptional regulator [Reticulibacter mediterranei]GHO97171.1 LacI family transcriptional regulator [Reticulibacter mediterranei]